MKLIRKHWPKFQEEFKKLHSAEIYQTETQIKEKEPTTNTHAITKGIYCKLNISNTKNYSKG